jgi:4,5-DOPA dioxygenase extradiol
MNALLVNPYTEQWAALGATLQRPRAILSISAHWYIRDAALTIGTAPRIIHGLPRCQIATTRFHTSNHNEIFSLRFPF